MRHLIAILGGWIVSGLIAILLTPSGDPFSCLLWFFPLLVGVNVFYWCGTRCGPASSWRANKPRHLLIGLCIEIIAGGLVDLLVSPDHFVLWCLALTLPWLTFIVFYLLGIRSQRLAPLASRCQE